jgi:hypothetical protein
MKTQILSGCAVRFSAKPLLIMAGMIIALSVVFFGLQPASAATCTYQQTEGDGTNGWNTATNWSCAHVPTTGDDVVIPVGTTTNIGAQPAVGAVSTITINANGTATGTLAITGAYTISATSTMTVNGTFTVATGNATGSALTIGAGGAFTVTTGSASTTSITNGGTLTIGAGTVTSTGAIINTGTITFSGAGTLDVQGNLTNSGTFTAGSGRVVLSGRATQTIAGVAFNNLRMEKASGTATLGAGATVAGTLVTTGAGTLAVATGGTLGVTGTLTIGAGTTFTIGTGAVTAGSSTNSGTVTLSTGSLTISGGATSTGTLTESDAGLINVGGYLTLTGTFSPGTGTLRLSGSGNQVVSGNVFYNLDVTSAGTVTLTTSSTVAGALTTSGAGTLSVASAGGMRVVGTSTIGSGTTYLQNAASSTFVGAIGNSGTMTITTGTVTSTGAITNSGTMSFTSGSLYAGGSLANTGTFTPGTLTTVLTGAGDQTISGIIFNTVSSTKTAGVVSFGASSTIIGTAKMGKETWSTDVASGGLTLVADFTVPARSVFDIGQGSATSTGTFTNNGTLTGGTGLLSFLTATTTVGVFDPETGTIKFLATLPMNVTSTVYYNIEFAGGTTYTMAASSTANGTTNVHSGNTLAIAAGLTYVGRGTFTNLGTITLGTGAVILHPAESATFTDSAGTAVTSYTTPASMYVTVQDSNQNLTTAIETITVTITTNAAAGSDSESVTLTETGASTGIFRNSTAFSTVAAPVVWTSNGRIDVSASGVATASYTDSQDSSDTKTGTGNLVYSTATVAADTGGGAYNSGGGGNSTYYAPLPDYTTTAAQTQELLNNLSAINVSVHALVKLPDDGNRATQEDSAVYYIGADGKRHAFENAKVYATWYSDFSGVTVISAANLASIPLGSNVRYKPGARMVKFTTDPKVYAVSAKGALRWIKDEATVKAIYGDNWNTKIDDLSDTSYTNYSFGADIASASDYNPANEASAAGNISAQF